MVSSPVQNLSDFLKNKPPLVVFLICLVVLAVSTFYFAFEIEKDGPVEDSDKKHDWIKMLKHFNKLDVCLSNASLGDKEPLNSINDLAVVHALVNIEDTKPLQPFTTITGALSLQGWNSIACRDSDLQLNSVEISVNVPKLEDSDTTLCVSIKGPAQVLVAFKEPQCTPTKVNKNLKESRGYIISKLPKIVDPKFCQNGAPLKMYFDLNQPQIVNFLNDDVRTEIYIHLMWCSYFFVFLIFCIIIYAVFRKSEYLEKKEQSARLL